MKKDNLIWWILGGIGAYVIYSYYKKNNGMSLNEMPTASTNEILVEEGDKYGDPLLAQYNILMPADMVSKKVKAKGEELRQGRYAIQPQRINPPQYL